MRDRVRDDGGLYGFVFNSYQGFAVFAEYEVRVDHVIWGWLSGAKIQRFCKTKKHGGFVCQKWQKKNGAGLHSGAPV